MSGDRWEGGGLSPEEAERLASNFKPIWEADAEPTNAGPPGAVASSSPSSAEPLENTRASAPAQPSALNPKTTLLGVPAPVAPELASKTASVQTESIAVKPPQARTDAIESLPSIVIGGEATEAPRAKPAASFEGAAAVPVGRKGGFGKGLYVGLGIGAAAVIAAVLIASSGSKSTPAKEASPPLAATAPESKAEPTVAKPAQEAPETPTAASAPTTTPSASVIPAALPSPPEPAKVVPSEEAATPPKASPPPSPPRPASPPTGVQKPAPKPASKPAQPAAAPAKPRNQSGGSAIVRDTPF